MPRKTKKFTDREKDLCKQGFSDGYNRRKQKRTDDSYMIGYIDGENQNVKDGKLKKTK